MYRKDCTFVGVDFCLNFLKITQKYSSQLVQLNIKQLPFRDNMFDFTISIAVIHHIYDKQDRINAIKELIRVTKLNGQIFISVWCEHGNYKAGNNMINGIYKINIIQIEKNEYMIDIII